MAQIGFNIPLLLGTEKKSSSYQTHQISTDVENLKVSYQRPLAASFKRQLNLKETESVVFNRRFVVSTSLSDSKQWFKREIEAQIQRGGLFEDPFMPPVDSTVWPDRKSSSSQYRWLRPSKIVDKPEFISDGLSRFDIKQGELGDCWLLAALSSLSMHQNLLFEVVPPGQSFTASTDGGSLNNEGGFAYVGMFWFRFWYFGYWVDVVVDDRLPTVGQRLVFMHSSDRREFWSALLEKAYAKLVGSFEALRGGTTVEGMEDFTGGMSESFDLGTKAPPNLFSIMNFAHNRCSLLACSIDANPNEVEASGPLGLIKGHAYSITDVRLIRDSSRRQLQMVRLRNPWGNDKEWVGPWSDKSPEWSQIPSDELKKISLNIANDGEFWMAFDDFKKYFGRLELCHLSPEFDRVESSTGSPKRKWEMTRHEGEWLRNSTAGGCLNNRDTFHMNPQIQVCVVDADTADDDPTGTIVVGIMQKGMREKRQSLFNIGYIIYPCPHGASPNSPLTRDFFARTPSVARSVFANTREVCGRHKLMPGNYVIVPSTFAPNEEAKFLLRIFSERPYKASELDEQIAIGVEPTLPQPSYDEDAVMNDKLKAAFDAIAGESGDIEAEDLRNILNRVFQNKIASSFEGFSLETARSMVALMDIDTSGTLAFTEFRTLWYQLRIWLTIFKQADSNHDGKVKTFDLRVVLSDTGIKISNDIFKAIVCRYAHNGLINFDDYILLLVRLFTVFGKFKENLQRGQKNASFSVDEFLRCVLYT